MCTNEGIDNVTGLFLDGFASAHTKTICNCSLHATVYMNAGFGMIQYPGMNCGSTLTINTSKLLAYNCQGPSESNGRNINQDKNLIQLETNESPHNVKYCLDIHQNNGAGTLTIRCYSPDGNSTTSSTQSDEKITSVRSTTPGSLPVESSKSNIVDTTVSTEESNRQSGAESFPVAAVAGGAGALVIIAVVFVVVVVIVKRRHNTKHGRNSDNDGDYCNMDSDPYKYKNTKPSETHPGVSTNSHQYQNGNQTIRSPSDDYAFIDDEAVGTTRKPQVALKPNRPNTNNHDDFQSQPDHDDVSNMYAKVNKNKKPAKAVNEVTMPVMHVNELYAAVDKTTKGKQPLKAKPSGDVYAVVNKKKKSVGMGSESKGQGPESEITGDVYTEVRKPKKSGINPNIPKGSPGLIYTEVEFDENTDEPQGATGGDEKTDSAATEEDRVLYSEVC
ncbi:uncharacterized protein LOC121391340 isoform X2 [Gigantopelta aegis]|nr:uncharacterized protein LOC121391340 isoform X2 [Gigantopelta aegis]